jgi:alkylhydroperoxidase family enzyme
MYQTSQDTQQLRPAERVQALRDQVSTLPIPPDERAMLGFVVRLATFPSSMRRLEVDNLTAAGFGPRAIHDITQVTACFSFMNRLADGTGVTVRADREPLAIELFGQSAWEKHEAWSQGAE